MRCTLFIILLALPGHAEEREAFYGTWGTDKQCAREPVKAGGSVLAEPFEIDAEWLKQGQLWCRLDWFPVQLRDGERFSGAFAQCGEDAVRGHVLGMELAGEQLSLRWNVFLKNGPLHRCTTP